MLRQSRHFPIGQLPTIYVFRFLFVSSVSLIRSQFAICTSVNLAAKVVQRLRGKSRQHTWSRWRYCVLAYVYETHSHAYFCPLVLVSRIHTLACPPIGSNAHLPYILVNYIISRFLFSLFALRRRRKKSARTNGRKQKFFSSCKLCRRIKRRRAFAKCSFSYWMSPRNWSE